MCWPHSLLCPSWSNGRSMSRRLEMDWCPADDQDILSALPCSKLSTELAGNHLHVCWAIRCFILTIHWVYTKIHTHIYTYLHAYIQHIQLSSFIQLSRLFLPVIQAQLTHTELAFLAQSQIWRLITNWHDDYTKCHFTGGNTIYGNWTNGSD